MSPPNPGKAKVSSGFLKYPHEKQKIKTQMITLNILKPRESIRQAKLILYVQLELFTSRLCVN